MLVIKIVEDHWVGRTIGGCESRQFFEASTSWHCAEKVDRVAAAHKRKQHEEFRVAQRIDTIAKDTTEFVKDHHRLGIVYILIFIHEVCGWQTPKFSCTRSYNREHAARASRALGSRNAR
jgi:hypothetical protein